MHVVVWRFTSSDPEAFARDYGRDGTWARFFRRSRDYVRTDLLTDGRFYLTLDWWTSRAAYDAFRREHAAEYTRIDSLCEDVTTSEEKVGEFEELR